MECYAIVEKSCQQNSSGSHFSMHFKSFCGSFSMVFHNSNVIWLDLLYFFSVLKSYSKTLKLKTLNEKTNTIENENLTEKLVNMMEKFVERLTIMENNFKTTLLPFAPHHNFDSSNGYFLYIICPELILNIWKFHNFLISLLQITSMYQTCRIWYSEIWKQWKRNLNHLYLSYFLI